MNSAVYGTLLLPAKISANDASEKQMCRAIAASRVLPLVKCATLIDMID